jgi:hypothetical protein
MNRQPMITAPFLTVIEWLGGFRPLTTFPRYILTVIGVGVCLILLTLACTLLIMGPLAFSHLVNYFYGHRLLIQ